MYYDEDLLLDIRLNVLDKFVKKFVICEATYNHNGSPKKINFDINKFKKFEDKIIFLKLEEQPDNLRKINKINDNKKNSKILDNALLRENFQRNFLINGIKDASPEDLIILSDSDEIPDLRKLHKINKDKKYIAFSQKMYMYKINIQNIEESNWIGSKITKKKYIKSMQLLRNLKFKNYPFWRLDKRDLQIIEGGWHFSYLQSPEEILNKIKSFSHGEFNDGSISEKEIEEKILKNEDIFNRGFTLKKTEIDESYPNYIIQNKSKYSKWII